MIRYGIEEALPARATVDPGYLTGLLSKAAQDPAQRPVIIAVDALDEADHTHGLSLPTSLPDGVYFVATMREGSDIPLGFDPATDIYIRESDPRHREDVLSYVDRYITERPDTMPVRIAGWGVSPETFKTVLVDKSEGNFMYLVHVLRDINSGLMSAGTLDKVQQLPAGLRDYYRRHWLDMKSLDEAMFTNYQQPVICLLATVREPVWHAEVVDWTKSLWSGLEDIARFNPVSVKTVIDEWKEFLNVQDRDDGIRRYRIYHASLGDYVKKRSATPAITKPLHGWRWLGSGASVLTERASAPLASSEAANEPNPAASLSPYELRHLIPHMKEAGLLDEIHELLQLDWVVSNEEGISRRHNVWFELKEDADERAGFMADIDTAWDAADEMARKADSIMVARGIGLGLRYALITASLSSRAANIPAGLLLTLTRRARWSPSKAIASAMQLGDRDEVVAALSGLAEIFVDGGRAEDLIVASEGFDESERSRVLAAIATVAGPDLIDDLVASTEALKDEAARADVLISISARVDRNQLDRVIHAAAALTTEFVRARALASTVPQASDEQLHGILAVVATMRTTPKLDLLAVLAPRLAEADIPQALSMVDKLRLSVASLKVGSTLARRLPKLGRLAWFARSRSAVKAMPSERRALMYGVLGDGKAAKASASKIRKHRDRALAMAQLRAVPQPRGEGGPHHGTREARDPTRAWQGDRDAGPPPVRRSDACRPTVGAGFGSQPSPNPRARSPRAKARPRPGGGCGLTAMEIKDPIRRAQVLAALAPNLRSEAIRDVLASAGHARAPGSRPRFLATVARHLSEDQVRDAFRMANRIGVPADRKAAIGVLAPYLPDDLLDEAETGLEGIADVASSKEALLHLERDADQPASHGATSLPKAMSSS